MNNERYSGLLQPWMGNCQEPDVICAAGMINLSTKKEFIVKGDYHESSYETPAVNHNLDVTGSARRRSIIRPTDYSRQL